MNNEIKAKILMILCQHTKKKRTPLLQNFNSFFDYYVNNKDTKRAITIAVLKSKFSLSVQAINYLIKLIENEFTNFNLEYDPNLKNEDFKNIRKDITPRERAVKWQNSQREKDPYFDLKHRIYLFARKKGGKVKIDFKDFLNKFGENPICYISGEPIDLMDLNSFTFDHIIPICQGGTNELSNMGICTKKANLCKAWYTMEEFLSFCQQVLDYHKNKTQLI